MPETHGAIVWPEDLNYRAIIDSVTQIIFRTDARGRFTFLNAAWQTITGFTVQESLSQSFLRFVHPDDRAAHAEIFQPLIDNRAPSGGHLARYVTKAGGIRWLEVVAELGFTAEGAVSGMFGTLTDVTERRRGEEQLIAARARLEHLLVSSPTVIYASATDEGFRITFVSENVDRLLTWTSAEVMTGADFWRSALHPEDAPAVLARLTAGVAGAGEGRVSQQYRFRRRDGEYRWIHDDRQLVRDAHGMPLEMIGSWIDVTDHRRAEEERARLSAVVEQAAEAILLTTPDHVIEYVNAACEELSGYMRAELVGAPARIFRSGQHDETLYSDQRESLAAGRPWSGRVVHKRKDGSLFETQTMLSPLRDARGRVTKVVAGMIDITRARETEDQLRQAQKMQVAGRLAAGVAHDFNNILTVISGRAQLLLQRVGDPAARRDLDLIQDAGRRAAALTRQLLVFSRKDQAEPRRLGLNSVVSDVSKMLQRLIGEDIELVLQLAADLGDVHADTNHLGQVIMNLAVNARDAMPLGGRLTIATRNVDLDAEYADRHVGVHSGAYVELTVTDTGCGMDAETITHIFEPFFTTKGAEKGTGLGLSTVYGIVEQSGGHITVDSAPGAGATFRVNLPRYATGGPTAREAAQADARARSGSETVLLVEDEGDVRGIAREALTLHGYTVLEARDGVDALQVAAAHTGAIDLLIADIVMPRLGGRELLEQLRHAHPRMKVVFMSGYANREAFEMPPGSTFLGKPFTLNGLARLVRAVLDPA